MQSALPYIWDYNITSEQFSELLAGRLALGRLDRDWAMLRLIEYASYDEIMRSIGMKNLLTEYPRLRTRIRSISRKRGFDFLVEWVPSHHPEWLQ
jgi:hypothetical protein